MASDRRPVVFISYSHADRPWLDRLLVHLKPLERDLHFDVWADTRLRAGSRWRAEIKAAIEACEVAILLVSADFLASDFIQKEELPPLLQAADEDNKLIVPIVVGPCLLRTRPEILSLLIANNPTRPLTLMRRGEAEVVLRDVAERLLDRREVAAPAKQHKTHSHENFLEHRTWLELLKIGNWIFDPRGKQILGSGMNTYLLSRDEFGSTPFSIQSTVSLTPEPMTGRAAAVGMNAGVVLGYRHERQHPRYVHIALTGREIFVERIGFRGGPVTRDYEHVTEPAELIIGRGDRVHVDIQADHQSLTAAVNGTGLLNVTGLTGMDGRVGLRPWRSTMACTAFVVEQSKPEV